MKVENTLGVGASAPTPSPHDEPKVQVRLLTKHYGAVHAATDVSLEAYSGEVLALVGENGAGKSTVGKILAGAVSPSSGDMVVLGEPFHARSVGEARGRGISCAFQELSLIPGLSVAENLFLVDTKPLQRFSQARALDEAAHYLSELKVEHIDPSHIVGNLSLADRQIVEIARALVHRPQLLILDEATSALTPPGVNWLFERIREVTAEGGTVIYVSHRMPEIAEIADRVLVLRDGRVVGEFNRGQWDEDQLVALMAGRAKAEEFRRPERHPIGEEPVLVVEQLVAPGVNSINVTLRPGEIVGLGGLQGQGQAELLKALYGAIPAKAKTWRIAGSAVRKLTPTSAVRLGIGFVPEDRKTDGLVLDLGVGENLVLPWLKNFGAGGAPNLQRNRNWVTGILDTLGVRTRGQKEMAGALSGGNQQKLVFGRWVDRDRKILLLHDPTRGIDVGAKRDLYQSVFEIAKTGVAVFWLSTEVEELVNVCDRVLVMYQGGIVGELHGDRLTSDAVVAAALGVEKGTA
jgi:ribose transport system ATP-binding protein